MALFAAASLAADIADTPGLLITARTARTARTAQGVGAALAAPGVPALLTTNAPDESARLPALALFSAVSVGGINLRMVLGGLVTEYGTWRWTLFLNAPCTWPWSPSSGASSRRPRADQQLRHGGSRHGYRRRGCRRPGPPRGA